MKTHGTPSGRWQRKTQWDKNTTDTQSSSWYHAKKMQMPIIFGLCGTENT